MNRASSSLAAEFSGNYFGDGRRAARFRRMLTDVSKRPNGKVSQVFRRPADQQAAYDFLEHDSVSAEEVQQIAARATAMRCREHKVIYLVEDGSSLSLTDKEKTKGFGSLGARVLGARGLKMMNTLALGPQGQTIGTLGQVFWARGEKSQKGYRPLHERESVRWHEGIEYALDALGAHAPLTRVHVLADREADATKFMQRLLKAGCDFTIRANGTRKVLSNERRVLVRRHLKKSKVLGQCQLELRGKDGAPARIATVDVRAARVEMVLRDHQIHRRKVMPLTVIWAVEVGAPRGAEPIDWMLYTTLPVRKSAEAIAALGCYGYRWRIEDFHKMLKSGSGRVEDSQLRSAEAVIKWATIHAIVAARAQRLRDVARACPTAPATSELSEAEIEALVVLKTQEKRRTEVVSEEGLTIGRAVRWIGDLGGFAATGASDKMPGSTVIARGLERVLEATQLIETLRASGKIR